jgi:type II secretory pathway pseudopilin PulG
MQMGVQQHGYTIVEVTLFLAISSLLVLIALVGTGLTLQAARFSDSSRSIHAYVQKQYDNVLNGVNPRPSSESCSAGTVSTGGTGDPIGTTSCLLLGKLLTFKPNTSVIQTYDIVGTESIPREWVLPDYSQPDNQLIHDFQPTIVRSTDVDTFEIPWGATISGSKRLGDGAAVDALAFIRSPKSSSIFTYVYKEPTGSYSLADLIDPSSPADAANFNSTTNMSNFCFKSADAFNVPSKVTLTGKQGQDAIQLAFDAVAGDCDGN